MSIPNYKKLLSNYNLIKGDFGENRTENAYYDAEAKRDFVNKIYDECLTENRNKVLEIEKQRYEACEDILCDLYGLLFDVYVSENSYNRKLRDTIHNFAVAMTDEELPGDVVTLSYKQVWNAYIRNVKRADHFIWLARNDHTFNENCILA